MSSLVACSHFDLIILISMLLLTCRLRILYSLNFIVLIQMFTSPIFRFRPLNERKIHMHTHTANLWLWWRWYARINRQHKIYGVHRSNVFYTTNVIQCRCHMSMWHIRKPRKFSFALIHTDWPKHTHWLECHVVLLVGWLSKIPIAWMRVCTSEHPLDSVSCTDSTNFRRDVCAHMNCSQHENIYYRENLKMSKWNEKRLSR